MTYILERLVIRSKLIIKSLEQFRDLGLGRLARFEIHGFQHIVVIAADALLTDGIDYAGRLTTDFDTIVDM